jgi:hypothetical protein
MRVTVAMLADAARVAEGKLYIFGGQFDRTYGPSIPYRPPGMALACVLEVDYNEALTHHDIEVALIGSDGESLGPKLGGKFMVGHPPGISLGAPQRFPMVFDFSGLEMSQTGRLEWTIRVDGTVLERVPLEVVVGTPFPFGVGSAPAA